MISWAVRDLSNFIQSPSAYQTPYHGLVAPCLISILPASHLAYNPESVNYSTPPPGHRKWVKERASNRTRRILPWARYVDLEKLSFFSAWLDKRGEYGFGDLGVVSRRICTQLFWRTKLSKDERWMRGKCIGALRHPSSLRGSASWSYFF